LVRVLEVALRLAHPFMPFITEEIWQRLAPLAGIEGKTIMLQPWPVANEARIDQAAEDDIEWLKGLMLGTRNIRGEMNIGPGKPLPLFLKNVSAEDQRRLSENEALLKKLARSNRSPRRLAKRRCPPPHWSARWSAGADGRLIDKVPSLRAWTRNPSARRVQRVGGKLSMPVSLTRRLPKSSRRKRYTGRSRTGSGKLAGNMRDCQPVT
jgi:valyl-tRNA synthetase